MVHLCPGRLTSVCSVLEIVPGPWVSEVQPAPGLPEAKILPSAQGGTPSAGRATETEAAWGAQHQVAVREGPGKKRLDWVQRSGVDMGQ